MELPGGGSSWFAGPEAGITFCGRLQETPALERMPTRLECRLTAAASGDEALRQVETGGIVPDLLLTDTAMPGLSGVALIRRLRAARPGLKVVRMSGYADPDLAPGTTEEADTVFLPKPITIPDLIESIRRAMERA